MRQDVKEVKVNYKRYQRHFPVMGIEGQQKLQNARVCIIGCGGIGSPVSMYLAAAGVGTLGLVDFDVVELSNLQRQILFTENDLGVAKSTTAVKHLSQINSDVELIEYNERLDFRRACEIFASYDLIIDGSDNFQTRYAVNDACCKLGKPFISASVLKSQAQLSFFDPIESCYRCLYPSPPPAHLVPNCSEAGVLGASVGVVGTMAANMAVNFFLGKEIKQHLMIFDSDALTWQSYGFKRNPNCKGCVTHDFGLEQNNNTVIEVQKAYQLDPEALIIDVREGWELDIASLDVKVEHLPLAQVMQDSVLENVNKAQKIIVICKLGVRSQKAAQKLIELGFENVYNYEGGIARYFEEQQKEICY
ncbi:HesA/MoeB/ThiF family protein [Cysteiniphilum marinum]|uniref:HesA/MoeB/ThiF family protein n=1 Tax=Cysteiniphilum marinum TaxID=2774191 RepID=UPI001939AFC2|nr:MULTISPECIES: HesA/MoeB/ThiF family protein [Cysteiniphilum]